MVKERRSGGRCLIRTTSLTRSPSVNGSRGMKLAPRASEYRRRLPGCEPVAVPVARTERMRCGFTPRMLIWVSGEAAGVPGAGEIASLWFDEARAGAATVQTARIAAGTAAASHRAIQPAVCAESTFKLDFRPDPRGHPTEPRAPSSHPGPDPLRRPRPGPPATCIRR